MRVWKMRSTTSNQFVLIFQTWNLWSSQQYFQQHHWRRGKLLIELLVSESSLGMMPREMIGHIWNVDRFLLLLNGWLPMHSVKRFKIPQRQLPPQKAEENSCRMGKIFQHIAGTTSARLHQIIEKWFEMGSQTQLVVTCIKLHQTKGATQLILELLLLKVWRRSRLEQLKECLHMHWGCLQLEEVMVHCPNRSKDLELRMRISGEGCQLPMQAPTELPALSYVCLALSYVCRGMSLQWLALFCAIYLCETVFVMW